MRTRQDIKALLVSLLPAGSEQLYDLSEAAFIGGTLSGIAGALKDTTTDRIDQMRLEANPSTILEKIPDWEQACGLSNTALAKFGTPEQRRNAILSVLREHGSFSLEDIRAAVQPYFLYADPTQIQIIETDRAALTAAHTYTVLGPIVVPPTTTQHVTIRVKDDPRVSPAGATLLLTLTGVVEQFYIDFKGPDATTAVFAPGYLGSGAVANQQFILRSKNFAGHSIYGDWDVTIITGAAAATIHQAQIFVEGIGRNPDGSEGLGAAIFEFAMVADEALLGPGFDVEAAYRAIQRIKPAHTLGTVIQKSAAAADACAIPDTLSAIPDRAIPCN